MFGERGRAGGGVAVFDPARELDCGQAAEIAGQIGLGSREMAEADELIGAEGVVVVELHGVALEALGVGIVDPEVGAGGAVLARADAVAPVVAVGEAAAGPADDGDVNLLHAIDDLFADAVDVGDARTFADPDAVVDDAAEMLGELAVDLGGDGADALVEHESRRARLRLRSMRGGHRRRRPLRRMRMPARIFYGPRGFSLGGYIDRLQKIRCPTVHQRIRFHGKAVRDCFLNRDCLRGDRARAKAKAKYRGLSTAPRDKAARLRSR